MKHISGTVASKESFVLVAQAKFYTNMKTHKAEMSVALHHSKGGYSLLSCYLYNIDPIIESISCDDALRYVAFMNIKYA